MLHFVIGLPGIFSEWCSRVVAELIGGAFLPVAQIQANTPKEMVLALLHGQEADSVVLATRPNAQLLAAISEAKRNFVVAFVDPRDAVAQLATSKGIEPISAAQIIASSCGAVVPSISAPGALFITANHAGTDALGAVSRIKEHLNIRASHEAISRVAGPRATQGNEFERADAVAWWNRLEHRHKKIVTDAVAGYQGLFPSGHAGPFTWAPEFFLSRDRPHEHVSGPIDITGRSRCLFEGPDIVVPRGDWTMAFSLVFSAPVVGQEFSLEISAGQHLASCTIKPVRSGEYTGHLSFTISDASDQPLSVRFEMRRAAFDGTVVLNGITLIPQHFHELSESR